VLLLLLLQVTAQVVSGGGARLPAFEARWAVHSSWGAAQGGVRLKVSDTPVTKYTTSPIQAIPKVIAPMMLRMVLKAEIARSTRPQKPCDTSTKEGQAAHFAIGRLVFLLIRFH
jgi:hypothetical protein